MKIERYKADDGRILYQVANKKDEFLFMHCANGSCAVTKKVLDESVEDMLLMHNILMVEIIDQQTTNT